MSRTFRFFGRKTCKACQQAQGKIEYFRQRWGVTAPVIYYDVDQPAGMAEGAWYDVAEIPTIILEENDEIVGRWEEKPPRLGELLAIFGIRDTRVVAGEDG